MALAQFSPATFLDGAKFPEGAEHLAPSQAQALLAGLPLIFEPNQGQANLDPADPRAKFVAHGAGYSLFLGTEGAILSLRSRNASKQNANGKPSAQNQSGVSQPESLTIESLQMKLAKANPHFQLAATNPLLGKTNYFLGNDPSKWRSDVPQFARVRYENVYPGINLVFYGNQGRLEYDFQVSPGADPRQAELEFDGARLLKLKDGALIIEGKKGSVRFDAPHIYQQVAGREQPVEGRFVLRGPRRAGFAIGAYDRSRELVIDPVLTYSTYFGGSGNEAATGVAVQGGFIYLTGSTNSPNLPVTAGAVQTTLNTPSSTNIYIAQINPALGTSGLAYLTYLGGNGSDSPVGIGVDGGGNAYVAGTTSSTNFPFTTNAYQSTIYLNSTGTAHVFVSKVSPTSGLLYSSYLSGNGTDVASGMTIDSAGHIFVTGTTTSNNAGSTTVQFPASAPPYATPFQGSPFASQQFFVTEVYTQGANVSSITYSTYFGGGAFETSVPTVLGGGIAVDTNGNIYFTGTTNFLYSGGQIGDFPILNAYQPCLDQPPPTLIINPPTCTNSSSTSSFPDAFVAKLNPLPSNSSSEQLQFSTYLGGAYFDYGYGIALDTSNNVYVTGSTNSYQFVAQSSILSFAPYQQCLNNLYTGTPPSITCTTQTDTAPYDAFVAKLSNPASGSSTPNVSLTYFSYLGGSANEDGLAIAVDTAEGALLTGWTQSSAANPPTTPPPSGTFPVSNCGELQCELTGAQAAYIARINTQTNQNGTQNTAASWASFWGGGPSSAMTQGTSVALDVNQNTYFAGNTNSTGLTTAKPYQPCLDNLFTGTPPNETCTATSPAAYDAFVTELGTAANLSITGVVSLGTNQEFIPAGTQATFVYTLTNGGPDLAQNITVTDFITSTYTGGIQLTPNSITATGGLCTTVNANASSLSCTINSLQAGSTSTITIVLTPSGNTKNEEESFNGGTVIVTSPSGTLLAQTEVTATMSDYSLTASPNNVTVQTAGDTAVYQVQLVPSGIYAANIALSCSGTPTGSTCTFTTPTVTLAGNSPGSTTMNVTTTARPVTPPLASLWTRHFYAIWLSLPGLGLLGLGTGKDGRRRRVAGLFLLCTLGLLLFLPACHGAVAQVPVAGTPAGTYTLTVTAASGTDTKNQTVNLIVP
jgi:hypothetical protein